MIGLGLSEGAGCGEAEPIGAAAAGELITARAAIEQVVACLAIQAVVAGLAAELTKVVCRMVP